MILQALVDYYEELASQGKLPRPGWVKPHPSPKILQINDHSF